MAEILREAVLVAATLTTGLMAGVFGIYSNAIMPGLRRTDDRTFVAAFQSIDRAIINPALMATFLGALVLTAVAAATAEGCCPGSWPRSSSTSSSSWSPSESTCHGITKSRPLVMSIARPICMAFGSDSTKLDGFAGITYGHSRRSSRSACSVGRSSSPDRRSDPRQRPPPQAQIR